MHPLFLMTGQVCCCVINTFFDSHGSWVFSSALPQSSHIVSLFVTPSLGLWSTSLTSVAVCFVSTSTSQRSAPISCLTSSSLESLTGCQNSVMPLSLFRCYLTWLSCFIIDVILFSLYLHDFGFLLEIKTKTRGCLVLNISRFNVMRAQQNYTKQHIQYSLIIQYPPCYIT